MPEYLRLRIDGGEGLSLERISPAALGRLWSARPPVKEWNFVRHVESHGTWTYHLQAELGEGEQEYYLKIFEQSEIYRVALRKLCSRKGLRKPWRYPKEMLRHLFDVSPAKVGFETAQVLLAAGINTAEPVAFLSQGAPVFKRGMLLTRKIPDVVCANLAEYLLSQRDRLALEQWTAEKLAILKELAGIIYKLSQMNFFLPDLRLSNVLIQKPLSGGFRLWVIDLVEAEPGKPDEDKMLWHLIANPVYAQLFTKDDRIDFLKWYLEPTGRENQWPRFCSRIMPVLEKWWEKWYQKNRAAGNS